MSILLTYKNEQNNQSNSRRWDHFVHLSCSEELLKTLITDTHPVWFRYQILLPVGWNALQVLRGWRHAVDRRLGIVWAGKPFDVIVTVAALKRRMEKLDVVPQCLQQITFRGVDQLNNDPIMILPSGGAYDHHNVIKVGMWPNNGNIYINCYQLKMK